MMSSKNKTSIFRLRKNIRNLRNASHNNNPISMESKQHAISRFLGFNQASLRKGR